ncbi:GntR family transcriptional regulator [Saccharothrix sp. NRRL B-16348]|uniref:GntR family transcriptional regulator n=1 Tax=Saccharothrix sp. NRRL B-16348 TaxID=1415542 RepID=UPI000B1D1939|nr:winged helix-turn-helix domain-containing protein [Saccharothrix sp. NRRL B-16348]
MSSAQRPEPPYRRIVAELRARILTGDLKPGDRMLSTRQIAQRWGVAVATATRVVSTLRDDGLVETKVGSGTVISAREQPADQAAPRRKGMPRRESTREHVVRTAISIADAEGLDAVSCDGSRPNSASVRCRCTGTRRPRTSWWRRWPTRSSAKRSRPPGRRGGGGPTWS